MLVKKRYQAIFQRDQTWAHANVYKHSNGQATLLNRTQPAAFTKSFLPRFHQFLLEMNILVIFRP